MERILSRSFFFEKLATNERAERTGRRANELTNVPSGNKAIEEKNSSISLGTSYNELNCDRFHPVHVINKAIMHEIMNWHYNMVETY